MGKFSVLRRSGRVAWWAKTRNAHGALSRMEKGRTECLNSGRYEWNMARRIEREKSMNLLFSQIKLPKALPLRGNWRQSRLWFMRSEAFNRKARRRFTRIPLAVNQIYRKIDKKNFFLFKQTKFVPSELIGTKPVRVCAASTRHFFSHPRDEVFSPLCLDGERCSRWGWTDTFLLLFYGSRNRTGHKKKGKSEENLKTMFLH